MSRRDMWNERYAGKELVWSAGPNQLFATEIADLTPGKALDVACGEGRNAIWLAEQGWSVSAIDFSDAGISKARQIATRRGAQVRWIVDDVSTTSFPPGRYDLVTVLYLHTDLETRARWLPNIIEAVADSGTFICIGHDPRNITHGTGGPQNPELLPEISELKDALKGFRIEKAEIVERPVASDPGHGAAEGIALDSLVRAVRQS